MKPPPCVVALLEIAMFLRCLMTEELDEERCNYGQTSDLM